MRGVLAIACCSLALVACGSGGSSPKATTTSSSSPSTSAVPQGSIQVRPPSGPVGTSFQLLGTNFQPGEAITFEIDFPDGKVFKGQAHKATPDGAVSATYRATTGNPVGTYQVKATGDHGTQGAGQFQVAGPGATTATTLPSHTVTTTPAHATTTKKH